MGDDHQNPIAEYEGEFRKVGVEMSYIQSQMHSDYDSAESIADSDLEDGELRNMLASLTECTGREDHESVSKTHSFRETRSSNNAEERCKRKSYSS